MSFAQSIIIPLSLFKQCQFDKIKSKEDIETEPPSKKVMLQDQEKLLKQKINTDKSIFKFDTNDIMININKIYRPQIQAVLDKILQHPETITIDKATFEITLKGKKIKDSNIIKILQYYAKGKIVTRKDDIPEGAKDLYKILIDDLKIPPQWIPNKKFEPNIADPLARTRAGKNIQNGTGWVIYG